MKRKITFILLVCLVCLTVSGCSFGKKESKKDAPKYKKCEDITVTESGWHQYVDKKGNSYARYAVFIKNNSEKTYYNPRLEVHLKSTEDKDVFYKKKDIGFIGPGQTKCFCGKGDLTGPMTHITATIKSCDKFEEFEALKETKYQELKIESPSLSGKKVTFKLVSPDEIIKDAVVSVVLRKDKKPIAGYDIPIKDYPVKSNEHFVFEVPDDIPEGSSVEVYGYSNPLPDEKKEDGQTDQKE